MAPEKPSEAFSSVGKLGFSPQVNSSLQVEHLGKQERKRRLKPLPILPVAPRQELGRQSVELG